MKATLFFLVVVLCVVAISAQGPEQRGKGNGKGKEHSGGVAGSQQDPEVGVGKGKGKGQEKGNAAERAAAGKAHAQNAIDCSDDRPGVMPSHMNLCTMPYRSDIRTIGQNGNQLLRLCYGNHANNRSNICPLFLNNIQRNH
uniref:Uncharacterized protein n=1 Tax=Anopheles atroparvus TaxID=41427 RepID=A0A182IV25_ANOAO